MKQTLSAIKVIEQAARKIPGAISLAQGVPSLNSHSLIREAVVRAIQENKVDRYSLGSGMPELRSLIEEKLAGKGLRYSAENEILVTAGAIEALSATFLGLLEQGDEVILFPPTYYANYKSIIEMAGGKTVDVQLEEEHGWKLNIEKLQAAIGLKTKAILICNPNNPTGSIFSREELLSIGELVRQRNLLLVFDDVYERLTYGKEVYCMAKEPQWRNRVIRIVSMSKSFALTGWRIGFLHGPKELVSKIMLMHDNLINCAPVVSQYAAIAALQHEEEIVPDVVKTYQRRRELMAKLLGEMGDYFSFGMPEGAYYFFPLVKGVGDTMDFCLDVLEKAKVAVVPGEDFGPGGEGHIRLCFGRSEEDIAEGLARLKSYFEHRI